MVQTMLSSLALFITTLVTCRSLPHISCLRLLGCYMLYCKSEAKIGFKLFINTIIPTLLYPCSLRGSGNNSLGTVTCGPVHLVPIIFEEEVRRREASVALDTLESRGLLFRGWPHSSCRHEVMRDEFSHGWLWKQETNHKGKT